MRAFSGGVRAVKLERRRVSKLAKLDERVARLRRRVSEYEAAGWDEFVRVVDVLVEEGALADPVPRARARRHRRRDGGVGRSPWPSSTPSLTPSSTPSATPSATPTRPVLRATGGSATRSRACSTTSRTYLSTAPSAWRIWISTRTKPVRIHTSGVVGGGAARKRLTLARPASGASSPTPSAARARRAARPRWRDDEEDADANGDDDRPADVADDSTAYSTAYSAGGSSPSSESVVVVFSVGAHSKSRRRARVSFAARTTPARRPAGRPEAASTRFVAAIRCHATRAALCAPPPFASQAARAAPSPSLARRGLARGPRRRRCRARSSQLSGPGRAGGACRRIARRSWSCCRIGGTCCISPSWDTERTCARGT